MPIPFIIGAAVLFTGVAALGGHLSAKEKNEKAKSISDSAKYDYDNQLQETRSHYDDFADTVSLVGQSREYLINNPVSRFKQSLDIIKHLDIFDVSAGSSELARTFDEGEFDSMMAYGASLRKAASQGADDADAKSALFGALGPAAVGAYGTISALAGGAGILGGLGAGLGVMLTSPLAIVAAPVFLISAFKADEEADANLEKAKAYEAQCQAECEKLRIQSDRFQAMNMQFLIYLGLLDRIGTVFECYEGRVSDIVGAHRAVLAAQKVRRTREIFSSDELETIKTSMNLFNTVKTLCMMNLVVEKNGEAEMNSEFSDEFIERIEAVADSYE